MSTNRTEYDLVVLGGGIAGLGVAWEATLRGLKVLLLERDRFGAATSANSLRIIHGGLRYLQSLSLKRVLVSSREQYHLLKSNPNHISLLKCLMPLKGSGMRSSWPVAAALSFHSSLAHLCGLRPKPGSVLSKLEIERQFPEIPVDCSRGALLWYDAELCDHARFVADIVSDCRLHGAVLLEGSEVRSVSRKNIASFEVEYNTVDSAQSVSALAVVNALGAGQMGVEVKGVAKLFRPHAWCRAFNVILNRVLYEGVAIGSHSDSGRLFFAVPRASGTAIGTGYLPYDEFSKSLKLSDAEIEYFLSEFNSTLDTSAKAVQIQDVNSVEVGLLPAVSVNQEHCELYGDYRLSCDNGYWELLATKYTTFRAQAEELVTAILRYLKKPRTPSATLGRRLERTRMRDNLSR